MEKILVEFDLLNNITVEEMVSGDMTVKDALAQLVEAELVDEPDVNVDWFLVFKESGQRIDIGKSFAENGVADGDWLDVNRRRSTESNKDTARSMNGIEVKFVRPDGIDVREKIPADKIVKDALDQLVERD